MISTIVESTCVYSSENDTSEPIIIPRPGTANGRLVFITDHSASSANSEIDAVPPKPKYQWYSSNQPKKDPIAEFLSMLTRKEPEENAFIIIPSGGYFEHPTTFVSENGCKFRKEPDPDHWKKFRVVTIPEYGGIKVQYTLSVADQPEGTERIERAKKSWKRFGKLLFDDDGRYSLKSEFIANISTS